MNSRYYYFLNSKNLSYVKRLKLNPQKSIYLNLKEILQPYDWTVSFNENDETPFASEYKNIFQAYFLNYEDIYIDIDHDMLGKRKYISLNEVFQNLETQSKANLNIFSESDLTLFRQRQNIQVVVAKYMYDEYRQINDFTIIDELSCDKNKMILSNVMALTSGQANIPVFDNITLIVNCQLTEQEKRTVKYTVNYEKAIYHAVHTFGYNNQNVNKILDEINEQIWDASQRGTVVIHCLAGMHRAPTILITQMLYRYFVKGHKHLEIDFDVIYPKLKKIRDGVAPLSYIEILKTYKTYLKQKYGD